MASKPPSIDKQEPAPIAWTTLLAHWTRVAQAAVALPKDAEGDRWRESIPPLIALHAIACALGELDRVSDHDRASALDKADLLIQRDAAALAMLWRSEPMPRAIVDLLEDARRALTLGVCAGYEWVCTDDTHIGEHPGDIADALNEAGFDGDLFVAAPGVPLFATSPVAFMRAPGGGRIDSDLLEAIGEFLGESVSDAMPSRVAGLRQVYRRFDFGAGGPVEDVVSLPEGDPEPGQPLLVPAMLAGQTQPVSLPPRGPLLESALPVRFIGAD